jgi:hypothetical protein
VAEELAEGKMIFRCRLRADWSLRALFTFWIALGAELLLIGFLARVEPWIWMSLLTLPILAWFLEQEKRNMQHLMVALIDEAAGEFGLLRLQKLKPDGKLVPVAS